MKILRRLVLALLPFAALAACSDGSSSGSVGGASFNFKGSALLLANEDVIEGVEAKSQSGPYSARASGPLLYQIRRAPRSGIAGRVDNGSGTNLFAIDEDGNTRLAIDSDYPIEVLYTAISPDAETAYVAIQIENEDMRQLTLETGCAFFEVDLTNDEASCVAEGLNLQNLERTVETRTDLRGNIQFDDDGNVYFLAESFTVEGDQPHDLHLDWNEFILYRYDGSDVVAMSNDADNITRYAVMPTGELVVFSENEITHTSELILIQGDQRVQLAGDGRVDFFTTDTYRSVMHVSEGEFGVNITRPASGGGTHRTVLDTEFIDRRASLYGVPAEVMLGDDGNVYGVFDGGRSVEGQDSFGDVYQLMPFSEVPVARIELGREGWRSQARRTPLLMSRGYLFYRERHDDFVFDGASFGSYDSIVILNMNTNKERRLLVPETPDDGRFTLHSWQLSGGTLHFSALDNSSNSTVMGKIDIAAMNQAGSDFPASDFMSLQETATALGAATEVRQITVIEPLRPEGDIGGQPNVNFITNRDNLNSVSMEFTKYMQEETVQDAISFIDKGTGDNVPYLPVWGYRSLHLVPDLNGLGGGASKPLAPDTEYELSVTTAALDDFDWELTADSKISFLTRPGIGWYRADVGPTAESEVYANGVARFVGTGSEYETHTFKLARTPHDVTNFRFELSGVNLGDMLGLIMFFDEGRAKNYEGQEDGYIGEFHLTPWIGFNYVTYRNDRMWTNLNEEGGSPHVSNGIWQRYRIDAYANDFRLYQSYDGENFEPVIGTEIVRDRGSVGTGIYLVLKEAAHLDRFQLQELDNNGNPTGPLLMDEDFDDEETLPPYLDEDLDYWNILW